MYDSTDHINYSFAVVVLWFFSLFIYYHLLVKLQKREQRGTAINEQRRMDGQLPNILLSAPVAHNFQLLLLLHSLIDLKGGKINIR